MIDKTLLILLLIAHLLGDFYMQTDKLSDNKKQNYPHVLIHSAVYAIPVVLLGIFRLDIALLWLTLGFILMHFVIDSIKYLIERNKKSAWVYVIDQLVHLISLFVLALIFKEQTAYPAIERFFVSTGTSFYSVLKGLLLFLIIIKPANVTYKRVFINLKPISDEQGEKRTGAIIGNLERVLMALLLVVGQYTAIGLVITGKSIARYKKIAEDKAFAEYYLIGTFYSILAVLVPFLVLW